MREDWQDKECETRLEKCRGCENLIKRLQIRSWENDGVTKRKEILKIQHWACKEYGLHLNFVDRIIGGGCIANGKGKECPHFRN